MWELDDKESWAPKNWCFWTVVLKETLGSPLDYKEIKLVIPKGNQSWIFIGRTDAEAEAPKLWPPDVKNWLIGKDPDAGEDWRQEKGKTEDEMFRWHQWLDGHEFEKVPKVGGGQGSLSCFSSWGHKELDMTEWLNWGKWILIYLIQYLYIRNKYKFGLFKSPILFLGLNIWQMQICCLYMWTKNLETWFEIW